MDLPFTTEQFFGVFRDYNNTLWPAQLLLLALAYHLSFFTSISPPAYAFAAVFVAGALVFLWQGVVQRRLEFRWHTGARGVPGLLLVVYALIVYPAWSYVAGQPYLETPTFGLPCPTTIFTMGLLACLIRPYPRGVFVVPVLWSLVGVHAAFLLSVPQDLGLAVVAVMGLVLIAQARMPAPPASATATEEAGAVS